jgi:hypothetical protein
MTTAKPPARYGAVWCARAGGFALPSYTISWDTTLARSAFAQPGRLGMWSDLLIAFLIFLPALVLGAVEWLVYVL